MEAARLMARGDLETSNDENEEADFDDALAAFGLVAENLPQQALPVFWLWPENLAAFLFWRGIQTQWRITAGGMPSGMDYQAVWSELNNTVRPRKRRALFEDIKAMEAGALTGYSEQAKENKAD